jgi:hypothetical protein
MNPRVGEFEINGILQMSDDDFEEYLQSAVILYTQSQGPMPPDVFRSLLILLRYSDEESDLKEWQARGHIAYEIRRLAHWSTVSSLPIGSFLSWKRYGVRPETL